MKDLLLDVIANRKVYLAAVGGVAYGVSLMCKGQVDAGIAAALAGLAFLSHKGETPKE
jgi:hypothetical protein